MDWDSLFSFAIRVYFSHLYGYNFSISGRGPKSVVLNDVPLDYDTVIAFVSVFKIPVPRQRGREMSVPKLYVTDPSLAACY